MKIKGYNKLTLQIILLAVFTICTTFFTDTDIWLKYFNYVGYGDKCPASMTYCVGKHYHWNFRAILYMFFSLILFIITIIRIVNSHKEEDFI